MNSISQINKIGVVGAGQMGAGIAQVSATSGLNVVVTDISETQLERAKATIHKSLTKLSDKGRLEEEPSSIAERIRYSTTISDLADSQIAIEAVSENEEIKNKVLLDIDNSLNKDAIIATNTSSIPITRLAAKTSRPNRFIGMHFMNPVPLMKLVEIIPGLATDKAVTDLTVALAEKLGKETSTSQDYPGFVVNRILMPMINEAIYALMEGVATPEDIDKGMKLGTNQPMGPLALADFIGLDTCLAIMEVLHEGMGDSKYRPSPLLRKYVEAGFLGRKSGRGVYSY